MQPCLVAVRVGDDPASAVYVRNKMRACEEVGIRSEHQALSGTTTTAELADLIESLNTRADVDGILVQLPLPKQIDEAQIIEAIDPQKDVDGFHPVTVGRLARASRHLFRARPQESSSCSFVRISLSAERMPVWLVAVRSSAGRWRSCYYKTTRR